MHVFDTDIHTRLNQRGGFLFPTEKQIISAGIKPGLSGYLLWGQIGKMLDDAA
jgi:hypothetical protein